MVGLADVDRFKICIQDCMLLDFCPLKFDIDHFIEMVNTSEGSN